MITKRFTQIRIFTILAIVAIYSCKKIPEGYISNLIFYNQNPLTVSQGNTTVSNDIVTNGSTLPFYVDLLSIKDASGKDASDYMLKPDTVKVFSKGGITSSDTTLASLKLKLKDSLLAPFSINRIGGRLQFTRATTYVPIGTYSIDVRVQNVKGSQVLNHACTINVIPNQADTLSYLAYNYSDAKFTSFTGQPASNLKVSITHIANGPDQIIYVWKDKNGTYFNPSKGEITGRPGRPNWGDWNPYYPSLKTDTSIVYPYPGGVPQMPLFSVPDKYPGFSGGISYYSIVGSHTSTGLNANTTFSTQYFNTRGTFILSCTLSDITRIP
ncbi:hypothetical protein [Mucilaginibacter sp. KACC 22063]|uniref:hypothetical protein n=1 Tax=Mucilaginibacter sp. KACC 22063 TaxID=3025666 RepID=UPI0023669AA5|nr:hypothetical protein [Mucilaginibacter sp. KACC 22063]WDF55852.1 hypothetical protein PQ461_02095 [Mucilaginibacter sp. KACC 22063]